MTHNKAEVMRGFYNLFPFMRMCDIGPLFGVGRSTAGKVIGGKLW